MAVVCLGNRLTALNYILYRCWVYPRRSSLARKSDEPRQKTLWPISTSSRPWHQFSSLGRSWCRGRQRGSTFWSRNTLCKYNWQNMDSTHCYVREPTLGHRHPIVYILVELWARTSLNPWRWRLSLCRLRTGSPIIPRPLFFDGDVRGLRLRINTAENWLTRIFDVARFVRVPTIILSNLNHTPNISNSYLFPFFFLNVKLYTVSLWFQELSVTRYIPLKEITEPWRRGSSLLSPPFCFSPSVVSRNQRVRRSSNSSVSHMHKYRQRG